MRIWLVALLAACTGEVGEPEATSTTNAGAKGPAGPANLEELLSKPPPPMEGASKVAESIAQRYQAGLFRCPIPGGGRMRLQYGTERDRYWQMGPLWEMEIDPATAPAWEPTFDEITGEAHWLTGMAMPGATRSWARGRSDVTYEFEHPPAVAGTAVTCTAVRELPVRTVKGKVTGPKPFERDAFLAHCAELDAEPVYVAPDGTFEATMPVPCTVWVEQPGHRSQKVRVDPGEGALELEFALERDPLQLPEGGWTPEGKSKADATLVAARQRWTETTKYLEDLKEQLASDPEASKAVTRLAYDYMLFGRRIDRVEFQLNAPPEEKKPEAPPKPNPLKPKSPH
jgi:hypothetical protein